MYFEHGNVNAGQPSYQAELVSVLKEKKSLVAMCAQRINQIDKNTVTGAKA